MTKKALNTKDVLKKEHIDLFPSKNRRILVLVSASVSQLLMLVEKAETKTPLLLRLNITQDSGRTFQKGFPLQIWTGQSSRGSFVDVFWSCFYYRGGSILLKRRISSPNFLSYTDGCQLKQQDIDWTGNFLEYDFQSIQIQSTAQFNWHRAPFL